MPRRRRLAVLSAAALAASALAGYASSAVAAPPSGNPTYDLPAPSGSYSVLDGAASANGALASVDLAGTWSFTPKGGAATSIAVPGGGWMKQGFSDVSEATYERSITVPDTGRPQVTKIEFGAVNHQATLAVDGVTVATNTTSFTPSSFDITHYVTPGHTYDITVDVKGRQALLGPDGKSLTPDLSELVSPQGIFRSAYLRVYPEVYLGEVAIRPSVASAELNYDVSVTNASAKARDVQLDGVLTSENSDSHWHYPSIGKLHVHVAANSTQQVSVRVPWHLGPASYWEPNVPYRHGYRAQLHVLHLALSAPGGVRDTGDYRFGFKQVTQNGSHFELNGDRVNFRGDTLPGMDYYLTFYPGGHLERGDAYDTNPSFGPPSAGNPGWRQAVDNYERLNYNIVRTHFEPPTPYMLDVADELGLMILDESVNYGSCNCMDWVNGHDYAVAHVQQLVTRDRNHPSVVRWSQTNEPQIDTTDSEQFEQDLYAAIMAVDPTRPISVDGVQPTHYPDMTYSNFTAITHYAAAGQSYHEHNYTDDVLPVAGRPVGQGEYGTDAYRKQGFVWFGDSAGRMRIADAADIRPWTLLLAWTGFIPGLRTTDVVGPNLYGADNLADPWHNPQVQLVQRGFNPLLVADADYWNLAKLSDQAGDWPVPGEVPTLVYGSHVTREVEVFNDTFADPHVVLRWQATVDAPDGPVVDHGQQLVNVPLGGHVPVPLTFTAPATGHRLYLTLTSSKPGASTVLFRDDREYFELSATPRPTYVTRTIDGLTLDQAGQPVYSGTGWTHVGFVDGYGNWDSYDRTAGDSATVTFTGTRVKYYATVDANRGIAAVSLDGGPEINVDEYAASYAGDTLVWTSPMLSQGTHTLSVRITGNRNPASTDSYVSVDRFDFLELYSPDGGGG